MIGTSEMTVARESVRIWFADRNFLSMYYIVHCIRVLNINSIFLNKYSYQMIIMIII